jgi:rare lipoprotein A
MIVFLAACADNTPVTGVYPKTGLASWYLARITATGEKFDPDDLTCAMRKTDFNKRYKVCNLANNKCVVVRHNNFGPAKYLYDQGRIIDLSKAAFSRIAGLEEGVIKVIIGEE